MGRSLYFALGLVLAAQASAGCEVKRWNKAPIKTTQLSVADCDQIADTLIKTSKLTDADQFRLDDCLPVTRIQSHGTCYAHTGARSLETALWRAGALDAGDYVPTYYAVAANLEYEHDPDSDREFIEESLGPQGLQSMKKFFKEKTAAAHSKNEDRAIHGVVSGGWDWAVPLKAIKDGSVPVVHRNPSLFPACEDGNEFAAGYCGSDPEKKCELSPAQYHEFMKNLMGMVDTLRAARSVDTSRLHLRRKVFTQQGKWSGCQQKTSDILKYVLPSVCRKIPVNIGTISGDIVQETDSPKKPFQKLYDKKGKHAVSIVGLQNIVIDGKNSPAFVLSDSNAEAATYLPLSAAGCSVMTAYTVLNPGEYGYEDGPQVLPEKTKSH